MRSSVGFTMWLQLVNYCMCLPFALLFQYYSHQREKGILVQMIYIHLWYIGNLRGANQWYSSVCFPLTPRKSAFFCMAIICSGDTSSSFRHYCANHWLTQIETGLKTGIESLVAKNVHPLAIAVMLTQGTVCWEFIRVITLILLNGVLIMYGLLIL